MKPILKYKSGACIYTEEVKCFNGLYAVHVELTNRCNKSCWCCGRRKLEKEYPHLANFNKDMDFELVKKIAKQLPENIIVHLHNNGEPTLYPKLKEAIKLFKNQITHFDSNCILLLKRADEIIDNLDILTVSVIENDPLQAKQYETVNEFLMYKDYKKAKKPRIVFRLLGDVSRIGKIRIEERKQRWYDLAKKYNCLIATRTLHSPDGSFDYKKKVTIPEHGICLEILTHLAIDVDGNVSVCVRFDPLKKLVIGNAKKQKLIDIWYSKKRLKWVEEHIKGNRNCNEVCAKCDYWGIPIG